MRMKAFKKTLKEVFTKTLIGGRQTLSYNEVCAILTMAAIVVNNRLIALMSHKHGDLVPRTMNQLLTEGASRSALEHQAVQDELYLRASRTQQDLLNLWWKA